MSRHTLATRFPRGRDDGILGDEMPLHLKCGGVVRRAAPLATAPAAAFVVHQLRYWLAFGGRASAQLQAQGHSYLHSLVPWLVLLFALAAGMFLRAIGRALGGSCSLPRRTLSFTALWLICAASLVLIYAVQELLEGVFAAGHPEGLTGIFGYGGWWAIPAAVAVGLVLAALFHGATWVLHEVARRHFRPHPRPRRTSSVRCPEDLVLPPLAPLAHGWSGRGPPR